MKKILLIITLIMTMLLCGCDLIEKEPEIPEKVAEPISADSAEYGYYILNDGQFYELSSYGQTFSNVVTEPDYRRITWWTDGDGLVPVLKRGKGDIIYYSRRDRAAVYTLECMEDRGYTIGIKNISYDEKLDEFYFRTSEICEQSSLARQNYNFETDRIYLESINGVTDIQNYLSENGTFIGLEKGMMYELGVYSGTVYATLEVLCDTRYFTSSKVYEITSTQMTEQGYQIIDLPEELPEGYYVLDGRGMFYYER